MARGGGKWACKETTTNADGSIFSRWFAAPYDMSNNTTFCYRRGGGQVVTQGTSLPSGK